jgi:transposase, IS5 family
MKQTQTYSGQLSLDKTHLNFLCDPSNKWVQLSQTINWSNLEEALDSHYSEVGRPAHPIRLMCSLLIIKQLENLSDAGVVEAWLQSPYYQYFSGKEHFQWEQPCTPSNLTQFRNRIGEAGVKEIFRESIRVNGEAALEEELIADTTVQEKNITFPTDTKLHIKMIEECRKLASNHEITLRQSYRDTLNKLKKQVRFGKGKKQASIKRKAGKKIKTIAGRLIRELYRKLSNEASVIAKMDFFTEILHRQQQGCKKIYSTHEPETKCHSKGKAHKKYEYGNKVSVASTKTSNVVVSVVSFVENIHDSKTIEPTLEVHEEMTGVKAKKVLYDRGGRGCKKVGATEIIIPESGKGKSEYHKRKAKKDFRRRSAIEPIIGHLKHDFRMLRNYLKGTQGDAINALMAAAAFNFKRKMRIDFLFVYFLFIIKSKFFDFCPKLILQKVEV